MAVGTVSSLSSEPWSLIETLTFSGSSVTTTQDLTLYKNLKIVIENLTLSAAVNLGLRFNGATTGYSGFAYDGLSTMRETTNQLALNYYQMTSYGPAQIDVFNSNNSTIIKTIDGFGAEKAGIIKGFWNSTAAISSLTIFISSGTSTGTIKIYGIAG